MISYAQLTLMLHYLNNLKIYKVTILYHFRNFLTEKQANLLLRRGQTAKMDTFRPGQ